MSQEEESELTSSPVNESEGSNIEPLSTGKEELGESESSGKSETPHTLPIQAKLTIGEANDPYEQEADRVAAQVVQRIHAPETKTGGEGQVQRVEMGEDEEVMRKSVGESIQRVELSQLNAKSDSGNSAEASAELEGAIEGARGSGQPLDESVKEPMEREFGADFSGVRVHTDGTADELNQSIQAYAFTTGQDVFFREGAYDPLSRGGQELLAHELTHVVQQKGEVVQRMKVRGVDKPSEVSSPTRTKHVVALSNQAATAQANYGDSTFVVSEDVLTNAVNANNYDFPEQSGVKSARQDIQANVVIYQYTKTEAPPGGFAKTKPVTLTINGVSTLCEIGVIKGGDDVLKITHFKKL
ncbi:MAG TPA: hypothetical protein DCY91_29780 [Cyanobacteria bacterium UBA11370]|nr:hypothetical protein [Cyanobacteria bacterium UBA11370]